MLPHESPAPAEEAGKIEALEGLRGVAVLAVLLFHYLPDTFPGGFLGVDVFFVLSGFVITRALLAEHRKTGDIQYGRFLFRRAMRLMPAFWAVAAFVALVHVLNPLWIWRRVPEELAWALAYLSNWQAAYPAAFGPSMFFNHAWSLGVEQQFYLIWPLILVTMLRRVPGERLKGWILALIATAALWRLGLVAAGEPVSRLYHGSDMRADALLAGCLLAIAVRDAAGEATAKARLRYAPALGVIVATIFYVAVYAIAVDDRALYTFGMPVFAFLAAALIAECICCPGRRAPKFLRSRPLVALGTISYSVYLWHIPIWVALKGIGVAPLIASGIAAVATLGCATASYHLIEKRCIAFGRSLRPATGIATPAS